MKVRAYDSSIDGELWNAFINKSRNATFLFHRNFMDYHADRFRDRSLMVFDDQDKLVAVVPANITQSNEVVSHQGLTYGAIVLPKEAKLLFCLEVLYYLLRYLNEAGIDTFRLKQFPAFYNIYPTDEIEYALFLLDAELYRRDVAFVIDQQNRIPYTGNIRREGTKAERLPIIYKEDDTLDGFWNEVLVPNLRDRFDVKPVHSLEEIRLLKSYFPDNIKQYNVYLEDKLVAGSTLFITPHVVHCQYISASDHGRKTGCLNYLFKQLMDNTFKAHRYFDFGIANENEGKDVNAGMLFWKESFGGRAQKHDFYKINSSSFIRLEKFISNQ